MFAWPIHSTCAPNRTTSTTMAPTVRAMGTAMSNRRCSHSVTGLAMTTTKIDRQEPQGAERHGRPGGSHTAEQARAPHVHDVEDHFDDGPDQDEDQRGLEQPDGSAPQKAPDRSTLSPEGLVSDVVGETPHEEEQRYHLQEPGGDPQPAGEADGAHGPDLAASPPDHPDEPVTEDDHHDAGAAEEIHDPVATRRGRRDHVVEF